MATHVSKSTYQTVMKRDGAACVICKSQTALQLHHINGRGTGKTDNADNCVMLCRECHERVHQDQRRFRPKLNEYIERKKKNEID